jgi:hypothetical protein
MKNLINMPSEIEQLKNRIEIEEFKYKNAINHNKSYVVLKRIKEKISKLRTNLQELTESQEGFKGD